MISARFSRTRSRSSRSLMTAPMVSFAASGVLGETELTPDAANDTIGAVIKDRDDLDLVRENLAEIISGA